MTPQLQSLITLLERHQAERDTALAAWLQARNRADAAAQQAEQLVGWQADYRAKWTAQFRSAAQVEILRCYQSFSERLAQAVGQQHGAAAQSLAHLEATRQALAACEMRVAAVQKLIQRRLAEARHGTERRDQKHTDEAAQRSAQARKNEAAASGASSRFAPLY